MIDLNPLVWPSKYILGIANLNGPHVNKENRTYVPELGHPYSLRDAMEAEHASDAHLTCYALIDDQDNYIPEIPLMKKQVLRQIKAEGGSLHQTCIGLDWDCPGHLPLTMKDLCGFLDTFLAACALDERLAQWTTFYTTRHGCRVFYDLLDSVPVEDGERYVTSLLHEFKTHGVDFDISCRDWTRRFRLPKVVRDGIHTKDEKIFDLQIHDRKIDIKQFKKSDSRVLVTVPGFVRGGTFPDQEECKTLLYIQGSQGKAVQSNFHKKAKQFLKQTSYHDCVFAEGVPLCGDTGRNDFFTKMLGFLVPKMIQRCDATAKMIYAIFHEPLQSLESFAGKEPIESFFWNMLQDIYERDYVLYVASKEKEAVAIERGQTILQKMSKGMKQWCDNEDLFDPDPAVSEAFVINHTLACMGSFYYPLDEDGWFGSICLTEKNLIPYIRKGYLSTIIETDKIDMQGNTVSISSSEIINRHSTVVTEVSMSPLQGVQGRIDDMDGRRPVLQLPMYQRNPFLKGEFSQVVEGWLRALFGKNFDRGCAWIANALAFERGPICALSLSGEGSTGKKMLVEGLSECLEVPESGTGMDLCGGNNGTLMKTPFIFVNEGFPKNTQGMSPSDLFKSYTAGDAIPVMEKYKPRVNVINPLRIILTANDHDLLFELTRGKELTPDTKRAIGERILHFDLNADAADYLDRLGGRAFTEKECGRWIRGDTGQLSDYLVARHFMWLYEEDEKTYRPASQRYCVMGNCNEAESFKLASRSESLPVVMRAITALFDTPFTFKDHRFATKSGRAYVTMQGVLGYIREINNEQITERVLESVLKSIMRRTAPVEKDNFFYYEIDLDCVMEFCRPWSLPCDYLRGVHEIWKKSGGMG